MNAQSAQLGQSSVSSSPYETARVLPLASTKTTSESGDPAAVSEGDEEKSHAPSSDQKTQEPDQTAPLASVVSTGQLISVLGGDQMGRGEAENAPSAAVGVDAGALGADPRGLKRSAERAEVDGRTARLGGHDWMFCTMTEVKVAMGAGAVTALPMTAQVSDAKRRKCRRTLRDDRSDGGRRDGRGGLARASVGVGRSRRRDLERSAEHEPRADAPRP